MDNASFCLTCETRPTCKQICKPLEKYLKSEQAKNGYSNRHYRRKIRLFGGDNIDKVAANRAMELKYGKRWVSRQRRKAKRFME